MTLPDMNIEYRESNTAHSVPEPTFDLPEQLLEAIILNDDAKGQEHTYEDQWRERTLEILLKYIPVADVSGGEVVAAVRNVLHINSWRHLSRFVVDDMCLDFFNLALRYCLEQGQSHQRDKGFIDGSGIGYAKKYISRVKETLEQCFDAKYYYKVEQPLVYSPIDLSLTANAIHPGHWSYPAGHGTKFLTAVEVLADVFHLDTKCYRELLIAACAAAMGRSGSLIHYPADNLAGGYLTNLKEWK